MSLTTLFFGQRKDTTFGFLTADVLIRERIDLSAEITRHPVEFGYEINDHVILHPIKIKTEFYISDQHIPNSTFSRVSVAYDILKLQWVSKLPFAYVSALEIFPACIAVGIGAPRERGDSITFDLDIQPITVIPPLSVPYPVNMVAAAQLATVASMLTL